MNFINPYNFIPIGSTKSENIDKGEKMLSGVIEYSVLTKTPVFIPNTSNYLVFSKNPEDDKTKDKKEVHKTYDFFSYNNLEGKTHGENNYYKPVIPGSEIRGMFRSNFEILTNSCMSALDSDLQLSKRTMESYKAGLLYKRKDKDKEGNVIYDLYKATDVLWRTYGADNTVTDPGKWKDDKEHKKRKCYIQKDFAEGERVKFKLKERKGKGVKPLASEVKKYSKDIKGTEGYIIKGEKSPGGRSEKHCCHIFVKDVKAEWKEIKISLLDDLLEVYAANELENASHYKEYREKLKEFKEGKGNEYFPVYYSIIIDKGKKKVFIAPACKTREIYDNTLKKLAKEFAPCTKESGYCEACELFGTMTEGDGKSSKIRFSDLVAEDKKENKDYYIEKPVTLPEMSSPKLNNMEFYLSRPEENAYFWTYDYYIDADGKLHIEQGKLSGRKFYWHQYIDDTYNPGAERGKRNITIRPLKKGITFHGKLFFDGISRNTLNKLIYLINAGDESSIEEKEHGYKIGTAKPLGLGSIACKADKVYIKSYIIKDGMVVKETPEYNGYNYSEVRGMLDGKIVENYDMMTGFHSIKLENGEVFSYPKTEAGPEGYRWFVDNHKGLKKDRITKVNMPNTRKDMVFLEYLEAMEPRVKRTITGNNNNGEIDNQ